MRTKFFTISVVLLLVLVLTSCINPKAEKAGRWYLPWTWGDKTLQQSLEEGCLGNALTTTIAGSVYPCPGYQSSASEPAPAAPAAPVVQQPTVQQPAAPAPAAPAAEQPPAAPADPLTQSLNALGFATREELITYFKMEGVEPREIATCPGEVNCVRVLREKDTNGFIKPFKMTNPTSTTFDGWRAAGQTGGQAKVPPGGPWYVEGVTIRPWR